MKRMITVLLPLMILASCSQSAKHKKESQRVPKRDVKLKTEKTPNVPSDTTPLKLITTGMFHSDEVWNDVSSMKWAGLFKGKSGYYLKQTKIKVIRVNDPVLDEENQKTGWELSVPGNDTSIVLLSPSSRFSERKVEKAALSEKYIYPDETVTFRYKGVDYKLFATGNKEKESENSDWYIVSNYKLYVTATIDGKSCKTLLSNEKFFDDSMITLIFAGDLDDDGIADFILDNSYHYNMTTPTVFLSKHAEKGQVVKFAALHTSVGC